MKIRTDNSTSCAADGMARPFVTAGGSLRLAGPVVA